MGPFGSFIKWDEKEKACRVNGRPVVIFG